MRLVVGGITHSGTAPERGQVARYLDDCHLQNLSADTIDQRAYVLARFEHHFGPLLGAEPDDIRSFLRTRNDTLAPETRATYLSHLRGFYRWAILNDQLDRDPTVVIPRPRLDESIVVAMPEGRVAKAIAHATDRIRPWLILAAFAGLRAKEIAGTRGEDFRLEETMPFVVVTHPKGHRQRTVPLAPVILEEIGDPTSGWLYRYVDRRPGPITPHLVSTASNRYLHKIGIPETLHSLRHRFGTQFFEASGYDIRLTQEVMGHESIKSTQRYTHVDQRRAGEVVSKLPTLGLVPELQQTA